VSIRVPPLDAVAKELLAREPIFHRPEFGTSRADFDGMMADDFWEVGASGRIYSREFVLDTLAERGHSPAEDHWVVTDFACREVAREIFLTTYQLEQDGGRLSRRSTLWRCTAAGWKILYHQGTLIPSA
jgi:hypothetical protein